jgi:hypothetical protein
MNLGVCHGIGTRLLPSAELMNGFILSTVRNLIVADELPTGAKARETKLP